MPRKPKLTDQQREKLKADFLSGKYTKAQLIKKHSVSNGTLEREIKAGRWRDLKEGNAAIAPDDEPVVNARVVEVQQMGEYEPSDLEGRLRSLDNMINDLIRASETTDAKSKEAAANAAVRAMELYRSYRPQTIDEWIEAGLAIPGFDPHIVRIKLRERLEQ